MRHIAELARKSPQAGFALFEFAIVITIIGLLTGLLLQRLFYYQREAELATVNHVAGLLRTVLALKTAELHAKNKEQEIPNFAEQNPMTWLAQMPHNYRGEYFSPQPEELPPDGWFFDRKSKTLVYLLNTRKSFPWGTPNAMKFKVKLDHSPQQSAEEQAPNNVTSVSFTQVKE